MGWNTALYIGCSNLSIKNSKAIPRLQKTPTPGNAEMRTHLTKHLTTYALPYYSPPFLFFSQSTSSVSSRPLTVCDHHSWCAFDAHAIRATLHCSSVLSFAYCSCTVPPSAKLYACTRNVPCMMGICMPASSFVRFRTVGQCVVCSERCCIVSNFDRHSNSVIVGNVGHLHVGEGWGQLFVYCVSASLFYLEGNAVPCTVPVRPPQKWGDDFSRCQKAPFRIVGTRNVLRRT